MSSNLESFCPKLRRGRVIPQGARLIFETDQPYNQIILPMALADLILLCSGQFSVREIVEKIYKKQGAVPFKSILKAIHVLHQGGFFENGEDLILNSHLRSWMDPRRDRWALSWRFGQRIVADRRSPSAYYLLTLGLIVGSILGLQSFPSSPLRMIETWLASEDMWGALIKLFICSSLIQSARYLLRGIQLLLLTGKAYNVSLRLSPWGIHLHVGDEANDLFENRLYTAMFHISQILVGWFGLFCLSPVLDSSWTEPLLILNGILTFWEMNPFVNSEGLKLIQALVLPNDRDEVSWHFEMSSLIQSLNADARTRDADFARICAIWGTLWLLSTFTVLHESAIVFGPSVLSELTHLSWKSVLPILGLGGWLLALYFLVQAFIETVVLSVMRPRLRWFDGRFGRLLRREPVGFPARELVIKIQDLPLFSHFHEQNLMRIIEHSEVLECSAKTLILRQGDESRDLYVLLDGEVDISRNTANQAEWVTELSAVSIFGEAALLEDLPRTAQVMAKTKARILKVPVQYIRQVAEESQAIRHLNDFRNAILVNQFFASSPVFRSLSNESVEFLCSRGALEYLEPDQVVFRQGDNGESIYLILRGSVDVDVHGKIVKRLHQGNFFGEIALIANIPRTATLMTTEACVFFRISADSFWEVLVQHIDLGVFIETVSESRLREDLELAHLHIKATGNDPL